MAQIPPKKYVVKSNDLVEARYRLSLQESHVVLWLLTQIKPDDEDFKIHELSIEEFANMVNLKVDGQYGELQKITESLMKRVMKIYEPEKKEWIQVAWLSSARYQKNEGCVLLEFSPQLKPYLLQLKKQFTKISIADTLKFKSIYAVRIYELLSQYAPIGKREISVDDLRAYCGIEEKEYVGYGMFKNKVVNKAKTEINAKTDYDVDFKEKKRSRKVDALDWTIQKKEHLRSNSNNPEAVSMEEVMRAIEELKEPPAIKVKRYEILSKIGAQEYFSWFHEAIFEEIEDGNIKMTPANDYAKQVWEDKYENIQKYLGD